jgi:hypothetical protein
MGKDRGVQFDFANESKGCLVNVPSHATEKAFLSTADRNKSKWIDTILKQVHPDSPDEAAQWLCTYIGKQHDDAFKTAATQLGFLSVVRMDAYDVISMFDDANAKLSQQRTIKQYLWRCFGNKLFIPDYKVRNDVSHNLSMPKYGNMEYLSEKAKLENNRPELIDHW